MLKQAALANQVDELIIPDYAQREPLPEGALVRGLERSALEEARAWLTSRYPAIVDRADATLVDSPGTTTAQYPLSLQNAGSPVGQGDGGLEAAGIGSQASDVEGVQRITLDNGALLFTKSPDT